MKNTDSIKINADKNIPLHFHFIEKTTDSLHSVTYREFVNEYVGLGNVRVFYKANSNISILAIKK